MGGGGEDQAKYWRGYENGGSGWGIEFRYM